MTYTKSINPAFEQVGKRKHLTGYLAELHDGNILLHSQEYSTNSQAEQALDTIVFDLLTDLRDQGLVDDVPLALEAEGVSSTHLPSWHTPPADPVPDDGPGEPIPGDPGYEYPRCRNCTKSHHTWQCPEIGALLFAEPVVMVVDVEFAPLGWAA